MGAVVAAIRPVVRDLDAAPGQRLVMIDAIGPGRRHKVTDPRTDPPPYWPSRRGQPRRRR
ncbi:MAG TPA: hypothetical protein VNQ77_05715 [Frankiaceae bacterium]|nr:hypothetical protein [Frankiaceae bacterium]